jgi:hypothetical protein
MIKQSEDRAQSQSGYGPRRFGLFIALILLLVTGCGVPLWTSPLLDGPSPHKATPLEGYFLAVSDFPIATSSCGTYGRGSVDYVDAGANFCSMEYRTSVLTQKIVRDSGAWRAAIAIRLGSYEPAEYHRDPKAYVPPRWTYRSPIADEWRVLCRGEPVQCEVYASYGEIVMVFTSGGTTLFDDREMESLLRNYERRLAPILAGSKP